MDSVLHAVDGNPIPDNHHAGFFTSYDGLRLRYAIFKSDISPAKGTVVLVHGRSESIEKYFETIRDLTAAGLWVATFDLRGQGLSDWTLLQKSSKPRGDKEKRWGHVQRFSDYERDLEQFLEQVVLPDCRLPFSMIAHSTGGLIALAAAPRLSGRISRLVLSAPLSACMVKLYRRQRCSHWRGWHQRSGLATVPCHQPASRTPLPPMS